MPRGVYERVPGRLRCSPGCACGRHTSPRPAASLANLRLGPERNRREDPCYKAVHSRLTRERGTPSICEHCGTTTAGVFEWAFAGVGHQDGRRAFGTNLDDYIRLCRSCHRKFDKAV